MVSHTQNPDDEVSYGALLAMATEATAAAVATSTSPSRDPQQAADLLVDFERFLAVGGRHLALLMAPASSRGSGIRQAHRDASYRLSDLTMERRGDNPWADAGDWLGLAHDVLATHLSPTGQLRTSEVEVLLEAGVQGTAVARVISLLEEPLARSHGLVTRVRSIQPAREPFFSHNRAFRLRQLMQSALLSLASAPPLPVAPGSAVEAVDHLLPAVTSVGVGFEALGNGLTALRLLRQLSYRQSQGDERANTHTLTELCTLGATVSRTAQELLPLAHNPLDRVHRANAVDQLATAEAAWRDLGQHLFPRVQGLTRAPTLYRDAIITVTSDAKRRPAVTEAVLGTLPQLAVDASRTVGRLQAHGELVWCGRRPGQLATRWHPLDPTQARVLASGFAAAGRLSRTAYEVWRHSPGGSTTERLSSAHTGGQRRLELGATS